MPFASIVVPTRNRPEFVRSALQSLINQTFRDFEVVVVDNHTGAPCRAVFDEIADSRFRYLVPDAPLPMHDNWELGVRHTTGDYVGVLIDKTVLRARALQVLHDIANRFSPDLVSWRADGYYGDAPDNSSGPGLCYPFSEVVTEPRPFDARDELARRFSLDVRRGTEGEHYFWGKICFGAFRRDLLERMTAVAGRVFFPVAPDYTSMVSALALARLAIDAGQACQIQASTQISNGVRMAYRPEHARAFLTEIDPLGAIFDALPIAGLYTSVHNVVSHDYVTMQKRLGDSFPRLRLDMGNLVTRAAEDLRDDIVWDDAAVQSEQEALLQRQVERLQPAERSRLRQSVAGFLSGRRQQRLREVGRRTLSRLPFGHSALRILTPVLSSRPAAMKAAPAPFDSIVAAAISE